REHGELLGHGRRRVAELVGDRAHRAAAGELEEKAKATRIHRPALFDDIERYVKQVDVDRTVRVWSTGRVTRLSAATDADSGPRPGAGMALASIVCVQIGIALSVGLFDEVGPAGAAALRLAWAGVVLLVIVRPRPSAFSQRGFAASVVLGVVTGVMTLCFM